MNRRKIKSVNKIQAGDDIHIRVSARFQYSLAPGHYHGRIIQAVANQWGRHLTVSIPQRGELIGSAKVVMSVLVRLEGTVQEEIGFLGHDEWPVRIQIMPNMEERLKRSLRAVVDPREPFQGGSCTGG